MRKGLSLALVFAVASLGIPMTAGAATKARAQQQPGSLNGVAQGANGQSLANYTVRVRSVSTGQIMGTTTSNQAGSFAFGALEPGNYVVEIVNASGEIVGTSASIAVATGATVTVGVTASAAGAIATASAGGFSLFGLGPLATVGVLSAAGVATVAGVVAARKPASPSK